MDNNYTPEQIKAAQVANAEGFLNQRIHDADRTPEQAQEELKFALAYNEKQQAKIASQIPKVQEIVRGHLKAAA